MDRAQVEYGRIKQAGRQRIDGSGIPELKM
jgi:hypothetical protein